MVRPRMRSRALRMVSPPTGPTGLLRRFVTMDRDKLRELHCIMPIENLPSVMTNGILSHRRAQAVAHESVADPEVQERRARVRVPGGRPLHEYANLYFHARNPMMYRRQERHADLTVLSVDTDVLDLPGVVVTDRNAAADFVRFEPSPHGLAIVDEALTFAESWNHSEYFEKVRRRQAKQAEVLVPDRVLPMYIKGAYVSCPAGENALVALGTGCPVRQHRHLFFR